VSNSEVIHTSDAGFENEVLKSDVPVLVDFWADWCGPCKMIAPILEDVARSQQGKIRVAKLNVDDNSATAAKFNIRSIPTLLLFKKGALIAQKVGAVSQSHLLAFLEGHLRDTAAGQAQKAYLFRADAAADFLFREVPVPALPAPCTL
jgi:thioredoxin 1